jgi:SPP1 gp7 family putative phage head morphogenesis protein
MPDPVDIRHVIHLPPDDTMRAFSARDDLQLTTRWSEMWHDDHALAFTVAKIAKLDLLDTIRNSLADVIANGGTFEQWQANIIPDLQRAGWWGRVQDRELTGTDEAIHVGPRRLRTIFDTNLRVSRAAGQWARIQELKDVAPYLRYSAVMDSRTRPLHRAWHGTILPVDHPWWDTHFPPCGWNCRCTVLQLSERDLARRGWSVAKEPPPGGPPSRFFRAGAATPEIVPAGIDPGFAYNPGKASLRAIADKAAASLERTAAYDLATARETLQDLVDSPAFLKALSEPGTAFPVMVLGDELAGAIGAQVRVAVLSAETFAKQRAHHPEVSIDDYRKLPHLAMAATLVVRDGTQNLILIKLADARWLVAVVKATATGQGLFVTSVRIQRDVGVRALMKKGEVLLDDRKG